MTATAASPAMNAYFDALQREFDRAYDVAQQARAKGFDPAPRVEIAPAADVAARVEGLVGPPGVAALIHELAATGLDRNQIAFELCRRVMKGELAARAGRPDASDAERRIEQAVRTGLALFTEGVVSAPIEGVSKIKLKKNADGSEYLAVYFTGPIRGAGGTGQAFTLVLTDYCRQLAGIANYRPTAGEVERYVEESNLYAMRTRAGQYVPTEDEIRHIARSCPVALDGEPTEDYEVSVNKNTLNTETNRVRGGLCLVLSEGVCLKAAKVLKIAKKAGLDWAWLEKLIKVSKQDAEKVEIKPVSKYIDEIVAGRPIFAYPMAKGGFRLRYGRTPFTGIAAKAINPATMVLLDEFPVIGTQVKLERPGKGCIVTSCESIEGPTVKLDTGEVRRVNTEAEAREVAPRVAEILFLGDLLVNYGDFLKANHPLVAPAWCEEWLQQLLDEKGVSKTQQEIRDLTAEEALKLARAHGVPLAPAYTYAWHDVSVDDVKELVAWLAANAKPAYEWFDFKGLRVENADKAASKKRTLELLGVPHAVDGNTLSLDKNHGLALLATLGLLKDRALSTGAFNAAVAQAPADALALVNAASGLTVERRAGLYVGASMGRPEKARERKMKPPVHALFPVAWHGGKTRDLVKAARDQKNAMGSGSLEIEAGTRYCVPCKLKTLLPACPSCGAATRAARTCDTCGKLTLNEAADACACGGRYRASEKHAFDLAQALRKATERVHASPPGLKGVVGLVSAAKTPEPLEKGLLRAKYDVFVFRDGTSRFDGTEIPATHFRPADANVSVDALKKLGYGKDAFGRPLESDTQTVELKPQDVLLPRSGVRYFLNLAAFVDDLLVYHYGLPPFYKANSADDLLGHQVIAIAPHISAGIIGRIVGFADVHGITMHPFLHCACRRNADGDEISVILLQDALLNFSYAYLPESRGGKMDAPLVLSTKLDPAEVDDEAHALDCTWTYPRAFYDAARRNANPGEVLDMMDVVSRRLGTEKQYEGIGFTHAAGLDGPNSTRYAQLKNMAQKVKEELDLMKRVRAVNVVDAAERIIGSHFLPDLIGNLRSFSKQSFRCADCNTKYRRVPLSGTCRRCGGKLLLTINKGGIEKYLALSMKMAKDHKLPLYLCQRLMLLDREIHSVFADEKEKQFSLADYL